MRVKYLLIALVIFLISCNQSSKPLERETSRDAAKVKHERRGERVYYYVRILYSVNGDLKSWVSDIEEGVGMDSDTKYRILDFKVKQLKREHTFDEIDIIKRDMVKSGSYSELSVSRTEDDGKVTYTEMVEQYERTKK